MNKKLQTKLRKIKALLLDVDGILTDGKMTWNGDFWARSFHIRDGYGIQLLINNGFTVALMSGSSSVDIQKRAEVLGISYIYLGNQKKQESFEKFKSQTGFKDFECLFMADDLFDIPVLKTVGVSVTVPETVEKVKKSVDYITKKNGGNGAVREICDLLIEAHKIKIII